MILLGISREDYWYSTPRDLEIMYDTMNEANTHKDRNILEIIRMQTFHLCHLKEGTTYKTFIKRSGMGFPWDAKPTDKDPEYKPVLTYEESINMQNKVSELINKKGADIKVPITKVFSPKTSS